MMWVNAFDWFNMTGDYYSLYWKVIKTTIKDISGILVIFLLLLTGFGNALMIFNEGRYNDSQLYQDFFGIDLLNTMMN